MKRFGLWVFILLGSGVAAAQVLAGTWTANQFIYKPAMGARGASEKSTYDVGLDRIDARLGKQVWVGDPKYGDTVPTAIANIGAAPVTLHLPAGTWNITDNLAIPANVTLRFERGAILSVSNGKTLTMNGPVDAGPYQIFDFVGTGALSWANRKQPLNQLWFANSDTGVQKAAGALNGGGTWYWPEATYPAAGSLTTRITLPPSVIMVGDGPQKTIVNSAVSGDVAIQITGTSSDSHKTALRGFKLVADSGSSSPSSGVAGIKFITCNYFTVENVWVEGFCTTGYDSAGNPATDLKGGFWISGGVGGNLKNCYAQRNDIGFYIENGSASVATTMYFDNCTSRLNRTHGIKVHNSTQVVFNRGVMESNNGLHSVRLTATAGHPSTSCEFKNLYFESNQRISGAAAALSREIYASAMQADPVVISNCFFGVGDTYPEIAIELAGTRDAVIQGCSIGGGNLATNSIKLNSDCVSTLISGNRPNKPVSDAGVATTMLSNNGWDLVFNDAADLAASSTPYANGGIYMKLPGQTVTNLQNCVAGQVLILEGQTGSALNSSTNFQLKNGAAKMNLAAGSIVWLRKDKTSGKFVLLGHAPAAPTSLTNGATQAIDDRPLWYVPDACVTDITTINGGYDGQGITLISDHTGANTTKFKNGTGNLLLAGDFTMGLYSTLKLVYRQSNNRWYEISRSAN